MFKDWDIKQQSKFSKSYCDIVPGTGGTNWIAQLKYKYKYKRQPAGGRWDKVDRPPQIQKTKDIAIFWWHMSCLVP